MIKTTLKDLIRATKGEFWMGYPHMYLSRISTDTRRLHRGDCYFALKGPKYDGHDFIEVAIEKNASAIVFSNPDIKLSSTASSVNIPALVKVDSTLTALTDFAQYQRNLTDAKVIAIAGSNGKTTTKNILYNILSLEGTTLKSYGNFNNEIGVSLTLFELTGNEKYVILELGISVAGEMQKLARIARPDVAIVTNIGCEHLQGLKTVVGVFVEEVKIFNGLSAGGVAVVNYDDIMLEEYIKTTELPHIGFAARKVEKSAKVTAKKIKVDQNGISFDINYDRETLSIRAKMLGDFNISNSLAAAGAALALGVKSENVKKGIENFGDIDGRMKKYQLDSGCVVINDAYNANPSSMMAALKSFCEIYMRRKKILILGDMLELGDVSAQEHRKMGEYVLSLSFDYLFLVGEEMANTYEQISRLVGDENIIYSRSKDLLYDELSNEKYFKPDHAVFFKGSHDIGLEELCLKLVELHR